MMCYISDGLTPLPPFFTTYGGSSQEHYHQLPESIIMSQEGAGILLIARLDGVTILVNGARRVELDARSAEGVALPCVGSAALLLFRFVRT